MGNQVISPHTPYACRTRFFVPLEQRPSSNSDELKPSNNGVIVYSTYTSQYKCPEHIYAIYFVSRWIFGVDTGHFTIG